MAEREPSEAPEIEREIGRGGSGVVYAARFRGQAVALKTPHGDLGERGAQRFLEEAHLLARVAHPSIVEVRGTGRLPDGRPYLVMPLLCGVSLAARLERGPLPIELALRLFEPLAGAVAHLHERGVLHRDIKPENVFYMEDDERLILLDFGIAREQALPPSTTTRANEARGTPATMAPERFFGAPATSSSDVYELAVVLFAMLTGRLPWDDATDAEGRLAPRRPEDLGVDLPEALTWVLMEALSTREDRRPTARDLVERLRKAAATGASAPGTRETRDLPLRARAPAPRARSLAPSIPPDLRSAKRRGAALRGLAVISVAAIAILASRRSPPADQARSGLGQIAESAMVKASAPDSAPAVTSSPTSPLALASAPTSEPARVAQATLPARAAPTTARAAPQPAPASDEGLASCVRVAEIYCSPAWTRPAGDTACKGSRFNLAGLRRVRTLPGGNVSSAEANCKAELPMIEARIRAMEAAPDFSDGEARRDDLTRRVEAMQASDRRRMQMLRADGGPPASPPR